MVAFFWLERMSRTKSCMRWMAAAAPPAEGGVMNLGRACGDRVGRLVRERAEGDVQEAGEEALAMALDTLREEVLEDVAHVFCVVFVAFNREVRYRGGGEGTEGVIQVFQGENRRDAQRAKVLERRDVDDRRPEGEVL